MLTPCRRLSQRTDGTRSPGRKAPRSICSSIWRASFKYSGGLTTARLGIDLQEYNCTGYIATDLHLYLSSLGPYYWASGACRDRQAESQRVPIRESPHRRPNRAVVAHVPGRMVEPRPEPQRHPPRGGALQSDLRLLRSGERTPRRVRARPHRLRV